MTYETYQYIFIVAAILCGVMIIVSVLLFIFLKIPRVIGDLTGATARKAIENIRNQNATSGDKTYRSSLVNQARGKLTDKISPSGSLMQNDTDHFGGAMATEKIGTQPLAFEDGLGETAVLAEDYEPVAETTLLSSENIMVNVFEIEYEITFIHTNEVISLEVNG